MGVRRGYVGLAGPSERRARWTLVLMLAWNDPYDHMH